MNPCKNNATCKSVNLGYKCVCLSNFTGNHCERENHCANNPCKNTGSCVNLLDSYVCNCPTFFTGLNCETLIDPCRPKNPCNGWGFWFFWYHRKRICESCYANPSCSEYDGLYICRRV